MNHRFPHIAIRRGTTLIEVLAGLVILSTLLVSLAMARGRFLRQWAQADQRIAASREIDQLMEQWLTASPPAVPIDSNGITDGVQHHPWQTVVIPSPQASAVGAIVVRLQVFQNNEKQSPLASVDVLLRDPALSASAKSRRPK
jgi:type II secretory pathway pseudopilin PulG